MQEYWLVICDIISCKNISVLLVMKYDDVSCKNMGGLLDVRYSIVSCKEKWWVVSCKMGGRGEE